MIGEVGRRSMVPIALALLAAVGAFVVGSIRTPEFESTAKVAFIEDTRFDYLDAERDRLVGYVVSAEQGQRSANPEISSIQYERPSRETFLDIVVRARDAESAAAVANALADEMVAADTADRTGRVDARIDAHRAHVEQIDEELALVTGEMEASAEREAFAEANRFGSDAATLERLTLDLRDAQADLFLQRRRRNAVGSIRDDTVAQIAELEVERESIADAVAVVSPASISVDPASLRASTLALVAGATVFALSMLMLFIQAPYVERRHELRPNATPEPEADQWAA